MLNVVMLSVIMLNVVMMSVVMISVIMLSVIMLSVVAPLMTSLSANVIQLFFFVADERTISLKCQSLTSLTSIS